MCYFFAPDFGFHFHISLFCKLWIALTSFRKDRGLTVFFSFLKFLIAHSARAAFRERSFVENCFACSPNLIQIFGVNNPFVFATSHLPDQAAQHGPSWTCLGRLPNK